MGKLKIVEPPKSLSAIVDTLDTHTYVLMIEYSSSPVRASSTALYFVGFVNVANFHIWKKFLSLGLFSLGTGLGNPWDMYRFSGGSRLWH